jgi:hypothetical protein
VDAVPDLCPEIVEQQGAWRVWAEVGIPMIVGTFLLDSSARAESIAEACEEIAGGNLNNFIVVACIAQAIALTGAAVGGEHIAKCRWSFASGSSCANQTPRPAWVTKLLPKITPGLVCMECDQISDVPSVLIIPLNQQKSNM